MTGPKTVNEGSNATCSECSGTKPASPTASHAVWCAIGYPKNPWTLADRLRKQREIDYWGEVNGVWTQAVLDVPLRVANDRQRLHWDCMSHGLYCLRTMPPQPKWLAWWAMPFALLALITDGSQRQANKESNTEEAT